MYARFWHFQTFSFLVIDALPQLNPSRLGYTVSLVQCMSQQLPVIAKIPRKKDCSNIYFFTRHSVKERQFHLLLQVMWSLFQATAKVAANYNLQVIVCHMTLQRLYFMYQYLSYHGDWVFHLNSFFLQTWLKVVSEILSTPLICCITSLIHVSFKSQQTKFESYIIKRL